jgi:hypothetical protein
LRIPPTGPAGQVGLLLECAQDRPGSISHLLHAGVGDHLLGTSEAVDARDEPELGASIRDVEPTRDRADANLPADR